MTDWQEIIGGLTAPRGYKAAGIAVMFLTPPESEATLDEFYRRVRPSGIGWRDQQKRTGIAPAQDLTNDILRVLAASLLFFGAMFANGGFFQLKSITGCIS